MAPGGGDEVLGNEWECYYLFEGSADRRVGNLVFWNKVATLKTSPKGLGEVKVAASHCGAGPVSCDGVMKGDLVIAQD